MTNFRVHIAVFAILSIAMVLLPVFVTIDAGLIYNPTQSAPRGWYRVRPVQHARVGDFVVVQLPSPIATFADSRGYLPSNVPLLKRVGAVAGQLVCARAGELQIDGTLAAHVLFADRAGRRMPVWSGCRVLARDELLLLSTNPSSFDGRYFGPLPLSALRGAAVPLWVWQ